VFIIGIEHIGPRLKDLMEKREMTDKDVSILSGYSQQYINDIKNGKKIPPIETLDNIAKKAFHTQASYFIDARNVLTLDDIYEAASPKLKEFLMEPGNEGYIVMAQKFKERNLKPEDIQKLIDFFETIMNDK
jgi:transcriptional regulator with XRE-family HTH domain